MQNSLSLAIQSPPTEDLWGDLGVGNNCKNDIRQGPPGVYWWVSCGEIREDIQLLKTLDGKFFWLKHTIEGFMVPVEKSFHFGMYQLVKNYNEEG